MCHSLLFYVLLKLCLFVLCSVIITSLLYLSDALKKNFLSEKFDFKVKDKENTVSLTPQNVKQVI